jgi:aminotransferase
MTEAFEIKVNPDILSIPYGDRKRIQDAARGKTDLVNIASGSPDLPMPKFITERVRAALDSGMQPYTNYYGYPRLRAKLADYLAREYKIVADPEDELLLTIGIQEGLYLAMRAILEPGDEVLMPSPHYAEYLMNTMANGCKPVMVPLDEESGWDLDIDRLRKAITPRTRAIVFCNPNNPLGIVWPRHTIEAIAQVAQERNLVVLVDEIYHDFTFVDPPPSIGSLPGMKERTFTFGGFSKSFMMMGMRMGYLVGPAKAIAPIKNLHYCVALCPPYLGQVAAEAALECPRDQLDPMYKEYGERLEHFYQGLVAIPGVTCVRPSGAFYAFPNVSSFGMTAMDLAIRLINEAGITTLPGTEFGELGEGHFRLAVCSPRAELNKGVERFAEWAHRFERTRPADRA